VPAPAGSAASAVSASALRLALSPVSVTLSLMLRLALHDLAMHDTTTKTNRRHVPTVPLRVAVPTEPPRLTASAAGVLLEMLREARPANQDQEAPPDAA
jgi:hypothetical protein